MLQDLADYQYDVMVRKSTSLLCRHYSGYEHVFSKAVEAQVCKGFRNICFVDYIYVP